jgi:hypothetical protein
MSSKRPETEYMPPPNIDFMQKRGAAVRKNKLAPLDAESEKRLRQGRSRSGQGREREKIKPIMQVPYPPKTQQS